MARILVAMSGGVDSSVAAKLLLDAGHEVAGVTLKLFSSDDIHLDECKTRTCCALSDVEDARNVAYKLGIEHFVFNFRDIFSQTVIHKFVDSYIEGHTPNPCIDCNKYVKFDHLLERAKVLGYEYVATGHYARITQDAHSGRFLLHKGLDTTKDQSYVLYSLTQDQLAHTLFPLGEMTKTEIREIAEASNLINARKPDSQDICFVPDGDYPSFIEKMKPNSSKSGSFISTTGEPLGKHKGVIHYTIGQRRGIGVGFGKPMYVVAKNAQNNTVTLGEDSALFSKTVFATDINLISKETIYEPVHVKAKIRYNQEEQSAVISLESKEVIRIDFEKPQRAVASGQAVVFYDGDIVLGGGTISTGAHI